MIKYFIQVIQNSLASAIIIAMLIAVACVFQEIRKREKPDIRLFGMPLAVLCGLIVGAVSAAILAFLRYTTALINREFWNFGILSAAIVSGVLFIALVWIFPKKPSKVLVYAANVLAIVLSAALMFYVMPDIFLYPTGFVLSNQSVFSTDFLFKSVGYLAGILVVFLAAAAVCKVGKGASLRLLQILFSVELLIAILNHGSTILQLLIARRLIPMSHDLFSWIKITINHSEYFLYAAMLTALLLIVRAWAKSRLLRESYPNPAERRKDVARGRKIRRWCATAVVGFVIAVLCVTVIQDFTEREVTLSPVEEFSLKGDEITIALENVNDGRLHRFVYTASDDTDVRFIIIKKNDVSYGVGLDACDICGPTGYYERGDDVICKLCDVVMNKQTIGFKGGCNPVPLNFSLDGANMVIRTEDLENEKGRFR